MRAVRRLFAAAVAVAAVILCPASPAHAFESAGAGWFWQNPQPFGWQFGDIAFTDASHVWARVGAGALYRSVDAGLTWQRSPAQPPSGWWPLCFPTADSGRLLHRTADGWMLACTDDGGAGWVERPLGVARRDTVDGVDFVNAAEGFATGELDGTRTRPPRPFLLRTADGGTTWTCRWLPLRTEGGCDFTDAAHGWVMRPGGRGLLWTDDGGATWRTIRLTVAPLTQTPSLVAADGQTAYVSASLGHGWPGQAVIFRVDVTPGGATVQRVYTRAEAYLGDVTASEETLYCTGESWMTGAMSTFVLRSRDGGATWSSTPLSGWLPGSRVAANGEGVLLTAGDALWRSADDGNGWTKLNGRPDYGLAGVDAVTGGGVWAVGTDQARAEFEGPETFGRALHSVDGARWEEVDLPAGPALEAVSFADALHGAAVGAAGRILSTNDGGATWLESPRAGEGTLYDVQLLSPTNGWAVGDGLLVHTSDGETWATVDVGGGLLDELQLRSVWFTDAAHGWIAGADWGECGSSLLLQTGDGGTTWRQVELSSSWSAPLWDVTFSDQLHGWIVAGAWWEGELFRTVDGGATWHELPFSQGRGLVALRFLDALEGYAVGGKVWHTLDAGDTWQEVVTGVTEDADWEPCLWAVDADEAGQVWVSGDNGCILSTFDSEADTAAPVTMDDADGQWHREAVTVRLRAADIGAAGVEHTEYRVDGETAWRVGDQATFNAPLDHLGDGMHWLSYRSIDDAGNTERTRYRQVLIDTGHPDVTTRSPSQVRRGLVLHLRYRVDDPLSPRASVRLTVYDYRAGERRDRLTAARELVRTGRDLTLAFRCRLPRGTYWYDLQARDLAGNESVYPGHGRFVVR